MFESIFGGNVIDLRFLQEEEDGIRKLQFRSGSKWKDVPLYQSYKYESEKELFLNTGYTKEECEKKFIFDDKSKMHICECGSFHYRKLKNQLAYECMGCQKIELEEDITKIRFEKIGEA